MTTEKEQSYFLIRNSIAFLYMTDLNDIFYYKDAIDEDILKGQINVLTMLWNSNDIRSNINKEQKIKLYEWLNSLSVLSIGVVNNCCYGDLLELIMMCDIRLGGKNLSIRFPDSQEELSFDFEERCQLLMGKQKNSGNYSHLLKKILHVNEIYDRRLINQIIDTEDLVNQIETYVKRIMENKKQHQIRSIMKCFNNYKQLGLHSNRELLLEEESKQFCSLIVKEYLIKEDMI